MRDLLLNIRTHTVYLFFLPILLVLVNACFGAEGFEPEFELATGVSWDSSLVVEEIDFSRETADEALNLEARASLAREWKNGLAADFSFSVTDSNYREADQFDLNTRLLLSSLAWDIGDVTASLTCYRADSSLGGDDYLGLTNCSPTASYFVHSQVYVQGGFAHTDKNFSEGAARDARNLKTFGSIWYFFDATRHYMSFTLAHRSEDANERAYDYSGNEVELNWIKDSEFRARDLRLKLGARFENRSYSRAEGPGSFRARADHRRELFSEIKLHVRKQTWVEFVYRFSENESTEEEVEYDQNTIELRLGMTI